jgi:hypothetical protein
MSRSDEAFLSRWSRLKREGAPPAETAATIQPDQAAERPAQSGVSGDAMNSGDAAARAESRQRAQALEDLESVDIEALDYSSDYTRFMQADVPDELKNRALRKLWASDPLFAYIDGFEAYSEDFTDAACVTPGLKTAYKIGRGFLTDEDVAAWEDLGKPQEPAAAPASKETVAAASGSVDVGSEPVEETEGLDKRGADAPSTAMSDAAAGPATKDRADVATKGEDADAQTAAAEDVAPDKPA